jgi:hypothetical protein
MFPDPELERKLRNSLRGAIYFAKRRQAARAAKGKRVVPVTVTLEQLWAKLVRQGYRCAVSGLPFWSGGGGSFGPTIPTLDRLDGGGAYSDPNTRIVLMGVNGLRGRGSDADVYRIAAAITARRPPTVQLELELT